MVLAAAFPVVAIILAKLIRPSAPFLTKLEAYECGIRAASNARGRYTVRFYIIAILFVIFDVETIFLFPWAVQFKLGQPVMGGTLMLGRKAPAFHGLHEPDDARVSCPESVSGSG